jgi:3-hydroxyisobutyrate dehydrogenase-like beta-hydroxyacid dehydrogenase
MAKDKSISLLAVPGTSGALSPDARGGSGSGGRLPVEGKIGFVGLGHMGTAMAKNLADAGHQVIAYVRRPNQMGKLLALGLKPTTDFTKLFDCEIVISMLPDDGVVCDVVFGHAASGMNGLASGLRRGAIHLSMSTISSAAASRFASEHARRGQGYVAAPVFGNPDAAAARQLFIVAAGVPADVERCRPVLDSLGQQTFVIGSDPAQANLIKLLGNMMTATALEMLGEAVALIRKRGFDPKPFIDIMTSTMFGGRVHRNYGDKIVRQSYAAGFVMPLALKDVRLALAEAENAGVPMPSVGVVRDRLIAGIARGYADLDWTALGLIAADEAGLHSPLESPQSPKKGARS